MKQSKKEQMSVQKQIKYRKTICGFAWVCAGVFEFFDNIVSSSLGVVVMIIALILTLDVWSSKREEYDEMATYNLTAAKSTTLEILETVFVFLGAVLAILSLVLEVLNVEVPDIEIKGQYIKALVFILFGAINFLVGINFHLLEKE